MHYMGILLLSASLILAGCSQSKIVRPKPEGYYLPEATVGRPYHQVIELDGSLPGVASLVTWPEDSGLDWSFRETKQPILELGGIPKSNPYGEIKVGIWDDRHIGMPEGFYKEYMIKLVPVTQSAPAKH